MRCRFQNSYTPNTLVKLRIMNIYGNANIMQIGGAEKVLAMLKGGNKKSWGSFTLYFSFSHNGILRAQKGFHSLKGGREKFYPVLRGGAKSFGPAIFPFCSHTPPPLPLLMTSP